MRAVDTNLIVRFLTRDDASQFALAEAILKSESIYIGVTVIIETCWVIERAYRKSKTETIALVRAVLGLPTVTVEDRSIVAAAFDWAETGLDIADALHLARSGNCQDLVTFDRAFARIAAQIEALPVTLLEENPA